MLGFLNRRSASFYVRVFCVAAFAIMASAAHADEVVNVSAKVSGISGGTLISPVKITPQSRHLLLCSGQPRRQRAGALHSLELQHAVGVAGVRF